MDPILTIPFSEITVINELEKLFKKREGYSIAIPSSRQQKGFDIILYNSFTKKNLTIQIKGSRTYAPPPPKRLKTERFKNYTWFNSFKPEKGQSDYYILFGLYIKTIIKNIESTRMNNTDWFGYVLLLFTEDEMISFLDKLTLKTRDDKDRMFGFGFNDSKTIYLTRGSKEKEDYSEKLLENQFQKIRLFLNPNNNYFERKKKELHN
jgi:hypothetical protein